MIRFLIGAFFALIAVWGMVTSNTLWQWATGAFFLVPAVLLIMVGRR